MSVRAEFQASGVCRIIDDNEVRAEFPTVYEQVFNSQYPPPLSIDGALLYVGTWRRGLHCYRVADGKLVWRKGPGKVRRIFPVSEGVVVEMADRGLFVRNQETGDITRSVKMGGIDIAARLSTSRLFAGPSRGQYLVLEIPSLTVLRAIPEAVLNPNRCLSFVIRRAAELDGRLFVSGFEEYAHGNYASRGTQEFSRSVA